MAAGCGAEPHLGDPANLGDVDHRPLGIVAQPAHGCLGRGIAGGALCGMAERCELCRSGADAGWIWMDQRHNGRMGYDRAGHRAGVWRAMAAGACAHLCNRGDLGLGCCGSP